MRCLSVLIFFIICSNLAIAKSLQIRVVRGMNFKKLKPRNYSKVLDYYFCRDCAVVEVTGAPREELMYSCSLEPIKKNSDKIDLSDCFVVQDGRILNNIFSLDKNGKTTLYIGSKINLTSSIESGSYKGIINFIVKEVN